MPWPYPPTPALLTAAAVFPVLNCACLGIVALAVLSITGKGLRKPIRRALHQARRRRTAKALHALRYDREYLLGQLPPIVSAKILGYLDRASLASLRASCRQASLLVAATGGARLRLDLPAVVHYTDVPLEAVWPRLKVLSLSLHATQDDTTAWLRPQKKNAHIQGQNVAAKNSGSDVGLGLSSGGVGSGGGMGGGLGVFGHASEPPSADCCIADAALKGFLHSKGLCGLSCIRLLELSHCSASFELSTWQLLARALPDGCTLVAPVSALQGAKRTGYASRAALAYQVLPVLKALAARSFPDAQAPTDGSPQGQEGSRLQGKRHKGLRLELVGVNLQVSSYAELKELCQVGAHLLVRLALSDTYPYTGHLPWGFLTLLSSLRELSVTPATPASLTALLDALPTLPSLTHLALGDVGSAHSVVQSLQPPPAGNGVSSISDKYCTIVRAKELAQLQRCAILSHLEVHTLRLPPTIELDAPCVAPRSTHGTAAGLTTGTGSTARSTSNAPASVPPHGVGSVQHQQGQSFPGSEHGPPCAGPAASGASGSPSAADANNAAPTPSQTATPQATPTTTGPSAPSTSTPTEQAARAAAAARTLTPLTNVQSLSVLHVDIQRDRLTGPMQGPPPSAHVFLHLFPSLTHLSLGVCPRSSRRTALGLTHAAAAASNSTAAALAAASSEAAAAAGLQAPRPLPLLPLLSGLQHLKSLALAGAWASQCVREASRAASPSTPGVAGAASLDVALAGLRHLEIHHCVVYDQLCKLLHPLLYQLPHLRSLGLHFCGTAPKAAWNTRVQAADALGQMQAASQALTHIQALLGNNNPLGASLGGVGDLLPGLNTVPGGGGGGGGGGAAAIPGPLGDAGVDNAPGFGSDNNSVTIGGSAQAGQEDAALGHNQPLPPGPWSVAATIGGATSLRELTIEGGDFRLAQELCMSSSHQYTQLALINCDMLLECDVAAALAVRARRQQAASSARAMLAQNHRQQQPEPDLPQVWEDGARSHHASLLQVAQGSIHGVPCPLLRLQVLNCRGIDGRALEMAALQLRMPLEVPIEVACTDWRSVEDTFEEGHMNRQVCGE